MPIILQATYSKKLGLPNYSSHSFSVSLSTELTELGQIESDTAKLYSLLQKSVDRELSQVGYLPDATNYGMNRPANGNGHRPANGEGRATRTEHSADQNGRPENGDHPWACSDKQRDLILKIVRENNLDKAEIEATAQQLFRLGVKDCNKLQASQIIEDLLEKTGSKRNGRRKQWRRERQTV